MKKNGNLQMVLVAGGLIAILLVLAGCGSQATATPELQGFGDGGEIRGDGNASPEFAAFGRSRQLALETLYLQDSDVPLTADQAAAMLPLWQQAKTLEASETVNADDLTSTLDQIEAGLTTEQSDLLANTTQEDLAAWAQAQGIQGAFGPGFGGDRQGGGPGGDDQPSDNEMATFMASMAQGTPQAGTGGPEGTPSFQGTPPAEGTFEGGRPDGGRFNNTELIDQVIAMLEAM